MNIVVISIVLTVMFFISGIDKILNFSKVVVGLETRLFVQLLPIMYKLAILGVIFIEILCPIMIVYSAFHNHKDKHLNKYAYMSCIALVGFTILATLIYHNPLKPKQYYPFISNVTTVGGLLLMAYHINTKKN